MLVADALDGGHDRRDIINILCVSQHGRRKSRNLGGDARVGGGATLLAVHVEMAAEGRVALKEQAIESLDHGAAMSAECGHRSLDSGNGLIC